MSETKLPLFMVSNHPCNAQASYLNSTPTTNNKKTNNKNSTPTPAQGAPHQYRKEQIYIQSNNTYQKKQSAHGIVDMKYKYTPFYLHGATACPLGQQPRLRRESPKCLRSDLSFIFGMGASPRPRFQQLLAAELGHRETCRSKLRAVENVDQGLALRVVVTEPVVALELVPLHRHHIVAAVPAGAICFFIHVFPTGMSLSTPQRSLEDSTYKSDHRSTCRSHRHRCQSPWGLESRFVRSM
jgi:hypothetical protein